MSVLPAIDFEDQVVVITGACGSLGRAYAEGFAARGAKLVLNDLGASLSGEGRNESAAQHLADELRASGAEAIANMNDISSPGAAREVIDAAVSAFGRIDVLVNNAGTMRNRNFLKMTPEDFAAVVQVHLMGSAYLSLAAFPHMKEQRHGRILMTTSAGGLYGAYGVANYGAAKMGLVGLMNVLKIEGAPLGITTNAIAPIASSRMCEGLFDEAAEARLTPEWIVPLVLFLSSKACMTSGDIITAGGGHYAAAQMVESPGLALEGDAPPVAEDIANAFPRIRDMTGARALPDMPAAVRKVTGISIG